MTSQKKFPIKQEEISKFHSDNLYVVEKYLEYISPNKTEATIKQYKSALTFFFQWVMENVGNRPLYELDEQNALEYQNYLLDLGLSINAVLLKRAVVSNLCDYVYTEFDHKKEVFSKVQNIFKGVEKPVN